MREDMDKLWSTEDLLGRDKKELLVWHHRLNHSSFKYLIKISKKGIIPIKLRNIRKKTLCVACIFGKSHKRPCRIKGKHSSRSKPLETRPRTTISIDHMVSIQPELITQFTGALTHTRFWAANVFMDH